MSTLVCVPVTRVKCRIEIDQGRAWTPVEELILWAISRRPYSIAELVREAGLPHQVVATAISRLNRFRFAEIAVLNGSHKFVASEFGAQAVKSGDPLPFFPQRHEEWAAFVIERVGGRIFSAREVRRVREYELDRLRKGPKETWPVVLKVTGGMLDLGSEAMTARVEQFVTRGRERKLALIDSGTATAAFEYIGVSVANGVARDLPEKATPRLHDAIISAAAARGTTQAVSVAFAAAAETRQGPGPVSCTFSADDIVIGGSAQRTLFDRLVTNAASRVVLHSTFINRDNFESLVPTLREACARDVTIDILWGAAHDQNAKTLYAETAKEITRVIREDPLLYRRIRIAPHSTGSHAKIILADTLDDNWVAAVSSCNWLKSPFRAVEITTILRHPQLVARIAQFLQKMSGERGLSDRLANELAIVAGDLAKRPGTAGSAVVAVVAGEAHDALMRQASSEARDRLIIGMHKLGANARPGALLPAEAASGSAKTVMVLYTMTAGPLEKRHARELAKEAAANGVHLVHLRDIPLHGKCLLWDSDNIVTTSINWGSAATEPEFPLGDIGVHICAPGIADSVWAKLVSIYPNLLSQENLVGFAT